MQSLLHDLAAAARSWRRRPGFAAAVVATLALAIGANTAIFTVLDGVLLKSLPFDGSDRLVALQMRVPDSDRQPFSIPDFLDLRASARAFEDLAAWSSASANLTGVEEPVALRGQYTTPGFFGMLGIRPALGRVPSREEEHAGGPRVVLLSYGLWKSRFGADPGILGRSLVINGTPSTVIGVLPRDFVFLAANVDLAGPLVIESDPRRSLRGAEFLRPLGRLRRGTTMAAATADLQTALARLRASYPDTNSNKLGIRLEPLADVVVGGYRRILIVLQASVAFVLLIACTNLANLLFARIAARRSELALRVALGARTRDLVRQVLAESAVLGLAGGALGLLLALAGVRGLLALAPTPIPRAAEVGIDLPILAFNLALSLATGLALGLVPAVQGTRSVVEAMRGGGRGQTEGKRSARTRAALVMAEVGLSLVLLVGAGLLLRTLHRLQSTDPGFKPERVLAVQLSLPKTRYASPEALARYADQIGARLSNLPGVRAAAAASLNPLTNWRASVSFLIEGRPDMDRRQAPGANYRAVGAGYFRALGVPVLAGREVDGRDRADGAPVALISDTLARRYFPKGSPIGARLSIDDNDPWRPVEVVGVVGDVKHTGLDAEGTADIYVPYAQTSKTVSGYLANIFCVAVRSDVAPRQLAAAVRSEVRALDRDVAVAAIRPMDEAFGDSLAQRRFQTGLLEVFGAAALLLALAGIYSVTAFSVVERTREIGVRISLGSGRGRILGLVFRQAMLPVGVGILFGAAAALGLGRLVAGLLFGVRASDPATLGVSAVLVGLAAFLASAIPALRATRIDPVRALRAE